MAANEERTRILKLIQDGKITADEGAQLLDAINSAAPVTPEEESSSNSSGSTKKGRWFRVKVQDRNTGKMRVNVRMPLTLISAGIKIGAKFSPEMEKIDQEQLLAFINTGEVGTIAEIDDEDDGEHVEVYIE
jgi:hypothetical protein